MIDLHCHIIPWVDDGAENAHIACAMAEHAAKSGVTVIVATPHCNLLGAQNNFRGSAYERRLGLFRGLLEQRHIPVEILPGSELLAHPSNLCQLLEEKRVVTLNRSRYLLVEFDFASRGSDISDALEIIARRALVPLVAHPERYYAVQEDPALAEQWFRMGYLLQVNKGSLMGRMGQSAREAALQIVRAGFAHVIASDAHDMRYRPPGFLSLLPLLQELCPPDYISLLLQENPEAIILDRKIAPP